MSLEVRINLEAPTYLEERSRTHENAHDMASRVAKKGHKSASQIDAWVVKLELVVIMTERAISLEKRPAS